jgi:beta-lactamase class A
LHGSLIVLYSKEMPSVLEARRLFHRVPMTKHEEQNRIAISRKFLLTLIAGGFALGVFVGAAMSLFTPFSPVKGNTAAYSPDGVFNFIRPPALLKDAEGGRPGRELKPFRYKINESIERAVHDGEVDGISVYFRDLNNGNRFGIGERDKVFPLSLQRLPLMIAYFKWSETNPVVLRKTLMYSGKEEPAARQPGKSAGELGPGKSYTVNDLIFRMIVRNDDAAFALLSANMPRPRLEKIYKELYVEYDPQQQNEDLSLSALAAFYRVLFNASYLSEEMSEKALRYLSRSSARNAMAEGIPPGIALSGKRGEQVFATAEDEETPPLLQVHEFGIIYHANRPFLLGFTVRGRDADQINKTIRNLTRLVYEEVDQQS